MRAGNGTCIKPTVEQRLLDESRLQRIRERAYFLWKDECHRVGGTVHCNDWYHWFEAVEAESVQSKRSKLDSATETAIARGKRSGLIGAASAIAAPPFPAGSDEMDTEYHYIPGITELSDHLQECGDDHRLLEVDGDCMTPLLADLARPEYAGMFLAIGANGGGVVAAAKTLDELLEVVHAKVAHDLPIDIVTPR